MQDKPFRIQAVLFDFDGTLSHPGALDFRVIKKELGCPPDLPVLEFINAIPDDNERQKARSALDRFEEKGARETVPNAGAEEIISYIRSLKLPVGIITRNSRVSLERAMKNFPDTDLNDFHIIITRDDPVEPKPSGDGVRLAAEKLGLDAQNLLMVGDYIFDIESGHRAGSLTVLLDNGNEQLEFKDATPDFRISKLAGLKEIIRLGLPLSAGKLPNELLSGFLKKFQFDDPSILISAGIGEDTAAVSVESEEVIVLKSDPITFATDSIGEYAVLVNANDIATSGAIPRWFITTLMFPVGITASEINGTMNELSRVCKKWKITLCGGHTEITDAVTRPVVVGMMAGTVAKSALIDKRNMKTGDKIIVTKAVAVEGTAIIAREFEEKLKKQGIGESDINRCKDFLSMISILPEANIAAECQKVSAMHDVTEGGLATALEELSIAGRHRIRIQMDQIPIFPETRKICGHLQIDPLGLIASGSLLICCRESAERRIITALDDAGIAAVCIGEAVEEGSGIEAFDGDMPAKWPQFETDEITRLF